MIEAVDDYLQKLTRELGFDPWRRRRIAAEVADHLAEARERYMREGLAEDEAAARAIADFGAPAALARSFAETEGVGMPTQFTRWGGLASLIGAPVLMITLLLENTDHGNSWFDSWFAEIAGIAAILVAVGVIALFSRVRGKLGWIGKIGFRMIFAGAAIASVSSLMSFRIGDDGGMYLLIAGLVTYYYAVLRARVLPSEPLVIIGTAPIVILVAVGFAELGLDPVAMLLLLVSYLMFMAGWMSVGIALWREPVETSEGGTPVTA